MSYQNTLTGKKVLVMGLGRNNGGKGCAIFALQSGASEIRITDTKDEIFNGPALEEVNRFISENNITIPVQYILNEHRDEDFEWADVVIKNPAVRFNNKYIRLAEKNGALIETEMNLFLADRNNESKVIGITGSKGKSSTTYLIYHILKSAKEKEIINTELDFGGNMGISMLMNLNKEFKGIYILELSSFVTEAIEKAGQKIDYFVITSLYPDHLNYYSSLDEYYHSKVDLIKNLRPENVYVNITNKDLSEYTKDFEIIKIDCSHNQYLKFPEYFNEGLQQNSILVARFLNEKFDISYDFISECLKTYEIVEGRFEFLGNKNNVDFINDTCASIPEAALMGLNTLKNKSKKIFLITGGSDKGLKFDEFFKFINDNVEQIYLIRGGDTFDLFTSELNDSKVKIFDDLNSAVNSAYEDAKRVENSVVILSRGCTSFGLANNEFELGKMFKESFKGL